MKIQKRVRLAPITGFKIGGPADLFCEPRTTAELAEVLRFAREKKIPFYVLGGGYNLLIADEGFRGLIIRPRINFIRAKKNTVIAGAGTSLPSLIHASLKKGLLGLEEFSGIPGTVGGALFINIHYYKALLSDVTERVVCLDGAGKRHVLRGRDMTWKYEHSSVHEKNLIVTEASFKLKKAGAKVVWKATGKAEEIIRTRRYKYPTEPSVGSVFQNIDIKQFYGAPASSAAYYIDRLGLKGKKIGGAMVSPRHANMIVNAGGASAKDVIALARLMKKNVQKKFKIKLKPEIQFVGFKKNPV